MNKRCFFCNDKEATVFIHLYTPKGEYINSYPGCKDCLKWKQINMYKYFRYESSPIRKDTLSEKT